MRCTVLFSAIVLTSVTGAVAQFIPGHVFIPEPASQGCSPPFLGQNDRIWEIDPDTGIATLFAKLPNELCGGLTSAVFTPDGTRLRVASFWHDVILEFDSTGGYSVALDSADGIIRPGGKNGLAYDDEGNFYVANLGAWTIMRFPEDGGPGEILADVDDGIANPEAIGFAADGDLYFAGGGGPWGSGNVVLQIDREGGVTLFDEYGPIVTPLAVAGDEAGNVYIGHEFGDILRYEAGNPASRTNLITESFFGPYAMTMTPDQTHLYVADDSMLYTVDVIDGALELVAEFPAAKLGHSWGIAVAPARTGDIDRNGAIDLGDYAVFQVCFGSGTPKKFSDPCHAADMDQNGVVKINDFAILQSVFEGP